MILRKLNETGISKFEEYIREGGKGPPPLHLLEDNGTSESLKHKKPIGTRPFENRYSFGRYLNNLLQPFNPAQISADKGLWTALALIWFEHLCPRDTQGRRSVKEYYYYILSSDYRHYYRHLVRSPWQLVKDYGSASQFLLISPIKRLHPLSVHGEILEQIGGRQRILRSKPIINAASKLYFDQEKGRPKTGVAASGRGSARRLGLVLRQFDLTYDPECMSDDAIIEMLPDEFNRWRRPAASARPKAA